MKTVLLATDSNDLFYNVDSALASSEVEVLRVKEGAEVVPAAEAKNPDLVFLDLQIGNMGGVASCIALRQEEGAGRLERRPIVLFLDREADKFLAQEAKADDCLVKPIDALQLQRVYRQQISD